MNSRTRMSPPPRPRVVPPLGLKVVDQAREVPVRLHDVPGDVPDHLLVRHRQHHVAAHAVGEARHLVADLVPAPRLLPQVRGVHHRHRHLRAADRVHLLAHEVLELSSGPLAEGEEGEDAGPELVDEARAEEEGVAGELGARGGLAEGAPEGVRHAHLRLHFPGATGVVR